MYRNLPPQMIHHIEELVDASFSGRDELYAAAETLDDERRSNICHQLADHLANHAIELQQLLLANGETPPEPLNMYAIAQGFFCFAKNRQGEAEVLRIAESCERTVKEHFDEVIDITSDADTSAMLERQRDDVEFGEHVLRAMQVPPEN